jgi:hypothetical protein
VLPEPLTTTAPIKRPPGWRRRKRALGSLCYVVFILASVLVFAWSVVLYWLVAESERDLVVILPWALVPIAAAGGLFALAYWLQQEQGCGVGPKIVRTWISVSLALGGLWTSVAAAVAIINHGFARSGWLAAAAVAQSLLAFRLGRRVARAWIIFTLLVSALANAVASDVAFTREHTGHGWWIVGIGVLEAAIAVVVWWSTGRIRLGDRSVPDSHQNNGAATTVGSDATSD